MPLLQRYIFWELTRVFCVLATASTLLLVFVGVFGQAKERGLGPEQILKILPYVAPTLLPFTIPAALLLTVCVVYGRMAGDREIIAAKAAGVHVVSLLWPALLLGALLSGISLILTDQVIPWSVQNIERTVTHAMEDIFLDLLRTQNHLNVPSNGISVTVMDVRDRTLIRPTFRYTVEGKEPIIVQAREAEVAFDLKRREVVLRFEDGHVDLPQGGHIQFVHHREAFPIPTGDTRAKARDMQVRQIQKEMQTTEVQLAYLRQKRIFETAMVLTTGQFERFASRDFFYDEVGATINLEQIWRLKTELHNRFAMASNCFFFVLFGSPFSVWMARKQFLTSFMFCFVPILVVYYPLSLMSQNLAKTGQVDPAWAVWIGNAVLLAASIYVFRKVTQN